MTAQSAPRPLYSAAERFWSTVERSDACWLWTGQRNERGYGRFGFGNGRHLAAHRVAWELTNGPVPEGKLVLHRCDNPPCVNPEHLFVGTHQDNSDDMVAKGRHRPAFSINPRTERSCPDCGVRISPNRRYCDRDRDRRRALTFLRQASTALVMHEDLEGVHADLSELIERLAR